MEEITKEQMAELLNGREIGEEISREEEDLAYRSELIVIFGYSDDCVEFRGYAHDECGAGDKKEIKFDAYGVLDTWENIETEQEAELYFKRKPNVRTIKTIWDSGGYSWVYETDIPHATFEVVEDGEPYCLGIVISVDDL